MIISNQDDWPCIGHEKQFFFDNWIIEYVRNIKRTQHSPQKAGENPLIVKDRPWENITYFSGTDWQVMYDDADKLFKCWYVDWRASVGTGFNPESRLCFAQSPDGINWEKPELGIIKEDGRSTNIILAYENFGCWMHALSVIKNPLSNDPNKRFIATYLPWRPGANVPKKTLSPGTFEDALSIMFSPDGVHWTAYERNPVINPQDWASDGITLDYDPVENLYVLMDRYGSRGWVSSNPKHEHWFDPYYPDEPQGFVPKRLIYRRESPDLIHWSKSSRLLIPDREDDLQDSFYCLRPFRISDIYLGILTVFHQVDNTLDTQLVYSRDGRNWTRMPGRENFIPRGASGSWDEFLVSTQSSPVPVSDELWFYYGGASNHHDWWFMGKRQGLNVPEATDFSLVNYSLGLAKMRLDGCVSLDATVREGIIVTKPFFSDGSKLIINAKCDSEGYVGVEILDSWDNPWDGFTRKECDHFTGDTVNHVVSWKGKTDVNTIPGFTKLRFYLRNAELYSFRVANE